MAAKLKRLRRENEILRQRDILKDNGFFIRDGLRPQRHGSERLVRRVRFELVDAAKKGSPPRALLVSVFATH